MEYYTKKEWTIDAYKNMAKSQKFYIFKATISLKLVFSEGREQKKENGNLVLL